jgi:hypothetical protein
MRYEFGCSSIAVRIMVRDWERKGGKFKLVDLKGRNQKRLGSFW